MRGRSLVDPNGGSQESKDMRIQLYYGRLKVSSCQRRRQLMEKLDVRLESVRHIQGNLASDEQRSHLIRLRYGSLSIEV